MKRIFRAGICGFTLIELLVVISIIGLLAALVFPALNSSLAKGKRLACLNSLKQIGNASLQFANDNNGWWPFGKDNPAKVGATVTMNDVVANMADSALLTDPKIWLCPQDRMDDNNTPITLAASCSNGVFKSIGNCSYAYLFGLGDRTGLQPSMAPAWIDESNQADKGAAPTSIKDLTKDDNHGERYRNVLYLDNHGATLMSGAAADVYKDCPPAGDSVWQNLQWTD